MTPVELEITENLLYNLGLPPAEAEELLRRELACALCEQGRLSCEIAAPFAGLPLPEFNALLQERTRVRETEEFLDREPGGQAGQCHPKGRLSLKIPAEVQAALSLPPEQLLPQLRQELALDLYEQWILNSGPIRKFAGWSWWDFHDLRGERDIVLQYSQKDLDDDLRNAARARR